MLYSSIFAHLPNHPHASSDPYRRPRPHIHRR